MSPALRVVPGVYERLGVDGSQLLASHFFGPHLVSTKESDQILTALPGIQISCLLCQRASTDVQCTWIESRYAWNTPRGLDSRLFGQCQAAKQQTRLNSKNRHNPGSVQDEILDALECQADRMKVVGSSAEGSRAEEDGVHMGGLCVGLSDIS